MTRSRATGYTSHVVSRFPGPESARLVVDLGALQPAAEIDVDRLPLGVRVERDVAGLAVAVAGLLPATERQVRLRPGRPGIDVYDPRLEVAHRAERLVHVAGEDARRQAEAGLVQRQHRRAVVVDRDHGQDRPEDLLLADPIHGPDAGEDRGLEEIALQQVV